MLTSAHPVHVTRSDVAFYEENGYFIYHHPLLPEKKFQRLKVFFEGMLADLPAGARPESMDVPHFAFPELFEWLLADEVLDFVDPFIGPDILLWSSHFLCKPPGDGMIVPWHEDSNYWGDVLSEHKVITVWLAIDDADTKNGCMRFLSGSHRFGHLSYRISDHGEHNILNQTVQEAEQYGTPVDVELKAGEISIHSDLLLHGSNFNHSDRRRCGLTLRYCTPDVRGHFDWNREGVIVSGSDPTQHWLNHSRPNHRD